MIKKTMLLVFLLLCTRTFCQEIDSMEIVKHPWLTDRLIFHAGFFMNSKLVLFNVDGQLPNDPIDFGKTLGLDRHENTLDFHLTYRFSKQKLWYAQFNFFTVRNRQTIVLEDEYRWANTIYPIGVVLESGFNVDMYRLFFGRVISTGKKHELSGGLGIHTLNIDTFVQASAYIGSFNIELDTDRKRVKVLAPVPNIGVRYLYAPSPKWAMTANVEWFALTIGDYRGTLWDLSPSVSYQFSKNVGLGVSYKYFKAKIDMNRKIWKGSADLLYQGPLFYVSVNL